MTILPNRAIPIPSYDDFPRLPLEHVFSELPTRHERVCSDSGQHNANNHFDRLSNDPRDPRLNHIESHTRREAKDQWESPRLQSVHTPSPKSVHSKSHKACSSRDFDTGKAYNGRQVINRFLHYTECVQMIESRRNVCVSVECCCCCCCCCWHAFREGANKNETSCSGVTVPFGFDIRPWRQPEIDSCA